MGGWMGPRSGPNVAKEEKKSLPVPRIEHRSHHFTVTQLSG